MPLRGACGLPVQAGIGRSAKPFTRRTNKVTSPFTRRTTSACGKVPLPNAHANAPTGGVRATSTGKASGGRQSHLCGAQIRPHRYLRGAQQARSAPRTAARWRCRVRTPMPLRGACGLPVQASLGRSAKPFTRRTTSAGGKVPPPGAHANAPTEGVRRLVQASRGWSTRPFPRHTSKATLPFSRRTTSAVSAANECEGITCTSK